MGKSFVNIFEKTESLALFIFIILATWILVLVKRLVFKRIRQKHNDLKIRFFGQISTAVMIVLGLILALSAFGGIDVMWKSMLGGTAFVSAVVVFMAQDMIKDTLAGLMIGMYRPFDIGDRIELEDGTAGRVVDVTMRHTVIAGLDTIRYIIPNRRLADMKITNFCYEVECQSNRFEFDIAYPTDVDFAANLIRQTIMQSDYTLPGIKTPNGQEYGPVYFMAFTDSSLKLKTTIYYPNGVPAEVVKDDVNRRVDRALWENGIEIPYPHISVYQGGEETKDHRENPVSEISWKTPLIKVSSGETGMRRAMDATSELGEENGLNKQEVMRLRLLGEELISLMKEMLGNVEIRYWVDHKKRKYRIHASVDVYMTRELEKKLLSVSSTGKNAASQSLNNRLEIMISNMLLSEKKGAGYGLAGRKDSQTPGVKAGRDSSIRWSMKDYRDDVKKSSQPPRVRDKDVSWDDLEKSIVERVADDISISIRGNNVEIVAFKTFQ